MPPELALPQRRFASIGAVPHTWRAPLLQLTLAWVGLILLTGDDWAEMARQWWNASTYNHILIVPFIMAWLVRLRWPELRKLTPQGWWPPLAWLVAGLLAWSAGTAAGINLVEEIGAVMLLQAAVATILGPRVAAALLFPLGYMLFLVPFGDEIMPPLQEITAHIAVALTHLSGVPATLTGVFIDTPIGRFEVAEACSGVKFLIAMIALGALVAHLCFHSPRRRALFMLTCVVVPVLANGVRAWGTIYVAQSRGVAFAAGFDHIVYGWVFFAIVMAGLLGVAWHFFDRPAHEQGLDAEAIEGSPLLGRLARLRIRGWAAVAVILLLSLASVWAVALADPFIEGSLAAAGAHP
jgi:exosortase A